MQSEFADGLFRRNEFDEDAILFSVLVLYVSGTVLLCYV